MSPSKSPKQKRFMAAAAHSPKFAMAAGISQAAAKEFNKADTRKDKAKTKPMTQRGRKGC
jgi:hypothetical protein